MIAFSGILIVDTTVQPIRIQINPDLVETAIMHILEVDANTSEMRLAAMHQINPLHTFMFNSRGKLLNANAAAIAACDIPGMLPLVVYAL